MDYILQKLSEPSTWAGIFTVLTGVAGVNVAPDLQALVVTAGTALVGLCLYFVNEHKTP